MISYHNKDISNIMSFFRIFQIQPKDRCVVALTKMSSCPACQGIPEILPCNDYCVNVMKGCLAYHTELDASWDKFIGKILKCQKFYNILYERKYLMEQMPTLAELFSIFSQTIFKFWLID